MDLFLVHTYQDKTYASGLEDSLAGRGFVVGEIVESRCGKPLFPATPSRGEGGAAGNDAENSADNAENALRDRAEKTATSHVGSKCLSWHASLDDRVVRWVMNRRRVISYPHSRVKGRFQRDC